MTMTATIVTHRIAQRWLRSHTAPLGGLVTLGAIAVGCRPLTAQTLA